MQKSVATFLAIAARNRVGPVFVETHSEHILRRILAHIGSGKMQPQLSEAEVAILYVTRVNGSSTVTQLEIAPNGTMATPWPNESANDGYRELLT
jgi:predicted ATPase